MHLILGFGGWEFEIEQPTYSAIGENLVAHGFPMARVPGEEIAFGDQKDTREGLRDQVAIYITPFLEEQTLGRLTQSQGSEIFPSKGSRVNTPDCGPSFRRTHSRQEDNGLPCAAAYDVSLSDEVSWDSL